MASFEGSIGTPAGYFNLMVDYGYSQSIAGNYSDVWATGYVKRNNSNAYPYNSNSSASLSINGSAAGYGGAYDLRTDGYKVIVSHSVRVYHDNNGNATIPISFSFNGLLSSYYPNGSISQNITLATIPRQATMTSASNFNDEINPSFTFTNPANASMSCWLEPKPVGEHLATRTLSGTSGTYTWTLTEEERTQLRNKCTTGNSCVCRIGLYSVVGGTTYASYKDATMSIVNANPVFDNFEFEDINSATIALTGDNQKMIQGYSTIEATIPVVNKATAQKGATMSKYSFVISDVQRDIPYSTTGAVSNSIDFAKSGVFNVYAIDSRNNSTLVTKNALQTIAYNPLVKGNINVNRNNGTSEQTTLVFDGKVDLVDFGQVVNSIQQAKYRYKQTDSDTWSSYNNITLTIDQESNFSFNGFIQGDTNEGFDIEHSYNIEVYIQDELSDITYTANLGSGKPGLAIHKQGIGIMGKYDTNEGGLLQIASKNVFKYSTDEVDTGFTWIDGKEIYRKVISYGSLSANQEVSIDISNIDFDTIVYVNGFQKGSANFNHIPILFYNSNWSYAYVERKKLVFKTGWTATNVYIILEYTKI